jgi:hypothetical protein
LIAVTALAVIALPALIAWRMGLVVGLVLLAGASWGLHAQAASWRVDHRAEVHARAPIDFRALDRAAQADASEIAGAIMAVAKIVGWLPIGATGLGAVLLLAVGRHRRRAHQGSGSTTSPDASR